MSKSQKNNEKFILVTTENLEDFFARGIKTARLLDQKKTVASRRIISFEDPADLERFLTGNKFKL